MPKVITTGDWAQLNSLGGTVAASAGSRDFSLLPIFLARLRTLMAIVPGLRDMSQPSLSELQSALERAEKLVLESMKGPISS